jgi:hypothetical protein
VKNLRLLLAALGLCLGAYGAGWLMADTQAMAPRQHTGRGPAIAALPDPQRLASLAAAEFEALPRAIWAVPAPPETPPDSLPFAPASAADTASMAVASPGTGAPPIRSPSRQETGPADAAAVRAAISQNLAAIVRTNGTWRLILADRATTLRQSLSVGDAFGDGWRISRIASDGVTLTRGRDRLDVAIAYAPAPRRMAIAIRPPELEASQAKDLPGRQEGTPTPRRRISRPATALNQE